MGRNRELQSWQLDRIKKLMRGLKNLLRRLKFKNWNARS